MINPYDFLGLSPNADKAEVEKMYKLYATKLHPDKHRNDPFFTELFKQVGIAHDMILSGKGRQSSYNPSFSGGDNSELTEILNLKNQLKQKEAEIEELKTLCRGYNSDLKTEMDEMNLVIDELKKQLDDRKARKQANGCLLFIIVIVVTYIISKFVII